VVLLLFFVAFKLGLNATDHFWHHGYSIGATASLFVVLGVLALGIIASVMFPGKRDALPFSLSPWERAGEGTRAH
jgi:tellurite resistance protein TerC